MGRLLDVQARTLVPGPQNRPYLQTAAATDLQTPDAQKSFVQGLLSLHGFKIPALQVPALHDWNWVQLSPHGVLSALAGATHLPVIACNSPQPDVGPDSNFLQVAQASDSRDGDWLMRYTGGRAEAFGNTLVKAMRHVLVGPADGQRSGGATAQSLFGRIE